MLDESAITWPKLAKLAGVIPVESLVFTHQLSQQVHLSILVQATDGYSPLD